MATQTVGELPGHVSLAEHDPELDALIEKEKDRQRSGLELIASENFTSRAVMECLSSCLTNKYSEGLPGARYYGGNEYIDMIESLCRTRALAAFKLDPNVWGVNVQPYSGSPANFAVYTALLRPQDRVMGLDLPSGGHLTHGYYTSNAKDGGKSKAISATSYYFQSLPYGVNTETGILDYEELQKRVDLFKPNMIICGGSAYPREWDYTKFRAAADSCGAYLMCDMAHISGLVAAGEAASPFQYADVVTTTTHKSLRGPRSGMIFFRKALEERINFAVFPMTQGGPHEHQIAAVATQLKEVATPEFAAYAKQVCLNARALAATLVAKGHRLATGGTDNHLILWDLRPHGFTGSKMEKLCEAVSISLNKNAIAGDRNAIAPGAVRVGTPALSTRGFKEADFERVGDILDRTLRLGLVLQSRGGKALADFVKTFDCDEVRALRDEVHTFARAFPMPGLGF